MQQEIFHGFEAFRGQCEFLEEDFSNIEAVNRGVKSRGFRDVTLNPVQEVGDRALPRDAREVPGYRRDVTLGHVWTNFSVRLGSPRWRTSECPVTRAGSDAR